MAAPRAVYHRNEGGCHCPTDPDLLPLPPNYKGHTHKYAICEVYMTVQRHKSILLILKSAFFPLKYVLEESGTKSEYTLRQLKRFCSCGVSVHGCSAGLELVVSTRLGLNSQRPACLYPSHS